MTTETVKNIIGEFVKSPRSTVDLKKLCLALVETPTKQQMVKEAFDTSANFPKRLAEIMAQGFTLGAGVIVNVRKTADNKQFLDKNQIVTGYAWGTDDICLITNNSPSKGFAFANCMLQPKYAKR